MGTYYYAVCDVCKVMCDLSKFYSLDYGEHVTCTKQVVDLQEDLKTRGFQTALLVYFVGKHGRCSGKYCGVRIIDDVQNLDELGELRDDGYTEEDLWENA